MVTDEEENEARLSASIKMKWKRLNPKVETDNSMGASLHWDPWGTHTFKMSLYISVEKLFS